MGYPTDSTVWPSLHVEPAVKDLIDAFFRLTDLADPNAGDAMADQIFTADGIATFSTGTYVGSEEIRASRRKAWDTVTSRRHFVNKVYVSNAEGDDLLFMGHVTVGFRNGQEVSGPFAGHLVFDISVQTAPKIKLFEGWADTAPWLKALGQLPN